MSRNFAVLGKSNLAAPVFSPAVSTGASPAVSAPAETAAPPHSGYVDPQSGYVELIRKVFHGCSVVAVVGSGIDDAAGVCDDIAAELAASGKRVVVVAAGRLLNMGPDGLPGVDSLPDSAAAEAALVPGAANNVWHWPPPPVQPLRFFKFAAPRPQGPPDPGKWLDLLRHNFDSVLFNCPSLEQDHGKSATGITDIAAMADQAVLVVEAGRTTKQRVLHDQRTLHSRGVRLVGSILVRRS